MDKRNIRILLATLFCTQLVTSTFVLNEKFFWKLLDYEFPDEKSRENAILNKSFVPENNLPVGIEKWNNKLFISVPRWNKGVPSTLNYIPLDQQLGKSPKLIPYPSLEQNELGNCENGLNTVYRIKADRCDRLWVLDTGTFGIEHTTKNPCPYAINVYDLKTDKIIRRYVFRPEDTNPNTFIANTVVDVGSSCNDTFAYFSDELGYGLIVYSLEQDRSWRFEHSFFYPDPLKGDFNIGGLNFQWGKEGIFGMALSPLRTDGYRDLLFSPLASNRQFSVSTEVLKNEGKVKDSFHDFKFLKERKDNSHVTAQVMDENGIMLFNLIDQNAIGCWNSKLPYDSENHEVVDRDNIALIFPSDVKIDADSNVWVISDRMPIYLESKLDYNDINFRIFTAPLQKLLKGTVCETQEPNANDPNLSNRDANEGLPHIESADTGSYPNASPRPPYYRPNDNEKYNKYQGPHHGHPYFGRIGFWNHHRNQEQRPDKVDFFDSQWSPFSF